MRFLRAVGRSWLPILVGAVWGTAVAFVALASLLVVIESQKVPYDFAATYAMAASALIMGAAQAGGVYGYITRRERS